MINTNVIFHNPLVTRKKRQELNRHKSLVVWFTGLSGAGKSTLAHLVEDELHKLGTRTFVLDGDNVRHGLSSNLKFNDEDRKKLTKESVEGKVITVKYNARIQSKNGDESLFLPIFVEVREDKDQADHIKDIK